MLKKILLLTLIICAIALSAISQPAYAQLSEFKITAGDAAGGDSFGNSVAISGDYAVLGAPFDDDNGLSSGSAYVFKRSGTAWAQEAKLLPLNEDGTSDGAAYDNFGYSVSISGDYAIVGARWDDDNGSGSGSAYVFKRSGTSWAQEAKLLPSHGAVDDFFGESVSISGDYAVVGAPGDDDNGSWSGSAYVFKRAGASWAQEAKLLSSDGKFSAGDYFGGSVSISGDYAIVGAVEDNVYGYRSGSAYVFKRAGASWAQEAKLRTSHGAAGDEFGFSVSISGDYAIVGADEDSWNGTDAGSAYIFERTGTSWAQEAKLLPSDVEDFYRFGRSVSISGDYAFVGAPGDRDNGSGSGSAYVFKRSGTSWAQEAKLLASDGEEADVFGFSVSISGDSVAVVGARLDDDGASNSGSAYLFSGYISTDDFSPTITDITDVPDDQGRWVFVSWLASALEPLGQITQYGVWELNSDDVWVSLGNVPTILEDNYTYLALTFDDSTDEGIKWSKFKVSAHTADPTVFYTSDIDSGYSVDNLAPAAPTGLLASESGQNTIELTWEPAVEEDFDYFTIYRSLEPGFDPTGSEPYATTKSVDFTDAGVVMGETYYYRLSTSDFNGNESEFSQEVSVVIVAVDNKGTGLPSEFALSQNFPNPFNPETVIEYALPVRSDVNLVIYNLRGEEVALLFNGTLPAGNHSVTWDASGLASGVYVYRLKAGGFIRTKKMLLLK